VILEGAGTRKGKLSTEAALRGAKKSKHGKTSTMTYHVTFVVEAEFGTPGAVAVKNGNRADQFFLRHVRLELAHDRSIHFECNSWVYPYKKTNSDRLFFINTVWNSVTHYQFVECEIILQASIITD
jgi:lipoxygenase